MSEYKKNQQSAALFPTFNKEENQGIYSSSIYYPSKSDGVHNSGQNSQDFLYRALLLEMQQNHKDSAAIIDYEQALQLL